MTTTELLRDGKLEKSCPACGRWEAASPRCSWCGRRFMEADYYRNGDLEARYARFPATAPAVFDGVPTEYRKPSHWPAQWGVYPLAERPPRDGQTGGKPGPAPRSRVPRPNAPRKGFLPRSVEP